MSSSLHLSKAPIATKIYLRKPLPKATYSALSELIRAYELNAESKGYGIVQADSQGMLRLNELGRRVV